MYQYECLKCGRDSFSASPLKEGELCKCGEKVILTKKGKDNENN